MEDSQASYLSNRKNQMMRPLINVGSGGREAVLGEGDGKILGQTDINMHLGHPHEYSHWEVA